jgi:hypothetical protein
MDFFTKIGDNVNEMFKKKEEESPSAIEQKPVVSTDPDFAGGKRRRKRRTKKHAHKKRKYSQRRKKGGLLPVLIAKKILPKKSVPKDDSEQQPPVSGGRKKCTKKYAHKKRKCSRRYRKKKAGDRESISERESERPTEVALKPEDLYKYYLKKDDEFENDPDYFTPRKAMTVHDLGDDDMGEGYIKTEDNDGWNVAHGGKKHKRKKHTKKHNKRKKKGGNEELSEEELDKRIAQAQTPKMKFRDVKQYNQKYVGPIPMTSRLLNKVTPKKTKVSFGPVVDLEEVQVDPRRNAVTNLDEFMSQGGRRKKRKTKRYRNKAKN